MKKKLIAILLGTMGILIMGCGKEQALYTGFNLTEDNVEEAMTLTTMEESLAVTKDGQTTEVPSSESEALKIAVHISGAVHNPGVYYFFPGERIIDAVEAAGGFNEDADRDYVNLAEPLGDGYKVMIPTVNEVAQRKCVGESDCFVIKGNEQIKENLTENANGLVNINVADEAMLMTLKGVGKARASAIIAYREENGFFQKPEDIMKVSGIKEAAYSKFKDQITVD